MAKKNGKLSASARKQKVKSQSIGILQDLYSRFANRLQSDHMDCLFPATSGQLRLQVEGAHVNYDIAEEAPVMAKGFFHLASFSQQLLQDRDDKVFLVETFAFLLGLSSGVLLSQDELADLEERIALLTEHRAKGGRATKRLTPEQEDIAKEYVRDELKPRVSITAACNRAAPKLLKEHGINVSGKTLMRLFPPQCRDSA